MFCNGSGSYKNIYDNGGWVAQMIEHQTAVAEVPGSNPASPPGGGHLTLRKAMSKPL